MRFLNLFLISALLLTSQVSLAQSAAPAGGASSTANIDTRGALGTILVSGLVGGIVGLSTLSFYSKPEKHIRNIAWGAGVGMICAAVYLTFDVAQNAAQPGRMAFYAYPDDTLKVANLGMSTKF